MTKPIRLVLVDDDPNVRRGLRMRFGLATDITVCGEAGDGIAALELLAVLRPDVTLLDVNLPGLDGIQVCVRAQSLRLVVVMASLDDSAATRQRCLDAGASGFVSKHEPFDVLLAGIRAAAGSTPGLPCSA